MRIILKKYTGSPQVQQENLHRRRDSIIRASCWEVEKSEKGVPNGAVNNPKKSDSKSKGHAAGKTKKMTDTYEVLDKFLGASLVGKK